MATVLVVDDDAHIREVARFALARDGHVVELEGDGAAALERAQRGGKVPIVFLSSRGEEADRVLGLELGADDYLAKPFSPRELVARVAAVLRRVASDRAGLEPRPVLALGPLAIDRDRHEVRIGNAPLAVTATELRLLSALALHHGRVLSRGQLIATVYGGDHHVTERTIDTHVRNLRAKLAAAGVHVIETVHGVGYRSSS
jgi:two-component system OmpR family response regulator